MDVAAGPCREDYVQWLASTARSLGLDIGIKNSFQLVDRNPGLIALWEWAVNESCFNYNRPDNGRHECWTWRLFKQGEQQPQ
jgi:hypothetical protein